MRIRIERPATLFLQPKLKAGYSAVCKANAWGLDYVGPLSNAAHSAIASMTKQTAADSLFKAMMTPRERPEHPPYSFYDETNMLGKAFAHTAATLQMKYQDADLDTSLNGDMRETVAMLTRVKLGPCAPRWPSPLPL